MKRKEMKIKMLKRKTMSNKLLKCSYLKKIKKFRTFDCVHSYYLQVWEKFNFNFLSF